MPSAAAVSVAASEKSRKSDGGRVERRPEPADVGGHRRRPGHGVLHAVVRGVAGALHLQEHVVGETLGEQVRAAE